MSNKIDRTLLALMAVTLAALPFLASGYVIYVVNLLMVFVVLALGLHPVSYTHLTLPTKRIV